MDTEDDAAALDAPSWAAKLLSDLGAGDAAPPAGPVLHTLPCAGPSAARWRSPDTATVRRLMCPVPLASCADGAVLAIAAIAGSPAGVLPRGGELLAERAALGGLSRNGRIAPGGACRLLDCADGRIGAHARAGLRLGRAACLSWASNGTGRTTEQRKTVGRP